MSETVATPSQTATATPRYAPLWLRLAALVYDLVAVTAIVMVAAMVLLAITGQLTQASIKVTDTWWYGPLLYLIVVAYFIASWMRGGQTLGMRPWRLRLCMTDGRPVRFGNAVLRAALVTLPIALLSLSEVLSAASAAWIMLGAWAVFYAVALVDRERRALHDIAACTVLLRMPAPPRRRRAIK